MKTSSGKVLRNYRAMPTLAFENQRLTSFAGLILFWQLFKNLQLLPRLEACFEHLHKSKIFTYGRIMLLLIVHVLTGYRRLRDIRYYKHDPLIKRVLGLNMLPDVSTVSRILATADEQSILNLRRLCREMMIARLRSCDERQLDLRGPPLVCGYLGHSPNGRSDDNHGRASERTLQAYVERKTALRCCTAVRDV